MKMTSVKIRRQNVQVLSDWPQASGYALAKTDARPQTILEEIVWHKEKEISAQMLKRPFADLSQKAMTMPPPKDFLSAIRLPMVSTTVGTPSAGAGQRPSVKLIAEVKKASPSKGIIRADFDPVAIAQAYEQGGASCLSVLCDRAFFQGSFDYLAQVSEQVSLPVMCKEFIISPYQLWQARAAGADAVLLIVAVLCDQDLRSLHSLARQLGMRALVEVHTLEELDRALALPDIALLGINNRNLEDFSVNVKNTQTLIEARRKQIAQKGITVVSESGIYSTEDLEFVGRLGVGAVLVGESLVRQVDIVEATRRLLECKEEKQ